MNMDGGWGKILEISPEIERTTWKHEGIYEQSPLT
jgi:hypothetical protein